MEMKDAIETATITTPHSFRPEDVRWALAWEEVAPGLGGWRLIFEKDEEGDEVAFAYPPSPIRRLVEREPWSITMTAEGVRIDGRDDDLIDGECQGIEARSLRDALLIVCPLSPEQMAEADALAALDHEG